MEEFRTRDVTRGTITGSAWVLIVGVAAIIVCLLLSVMWAFGFGVFSRATADYRGETELIEETRGDGQFRLQTYEHFFDLNASARATAQKVVGAEKDLEEFESSHDLAALNFAEQERYTFLTNNARGTRNLLVEQVEQYNADAAKETRDAFLDNDLPQELNADRLVREFQAN